MKKVNLSILFDCHTFDREYQGTSTFLAGLINAIPGVMCKYFPHVVLDIHCAASSNLSVIKYIQVPYSFHFIRGGFLTRNIVDIPILARMLQTNFVISQYVRPIWVPNFSVSIIHDFLFVDFPNHFSLSYRFIRKFFFIFSANFSDKVFTVSNYSRSRIAHICGIDLNCISVLPNAIAHDWPSSVNSPSFSISRRPLKLLYVSRLEQRKRHEWCMQAFIDLLQEGYDVQLILVGGGNSNYARSLRQYFSDLSIKYYGKFFHFEEISQVDLRNVYLQTDIFLFPSLCEGFGIPVIEAAAFGIPCVVTDGTALSELNGFYVGSSFEADSYSHFLMSVRNIMDSLNEYQVAAKKNIDNIKKNYSWEITAKRFISSLLELSN